LGKDPARLGADGMIAVGNVSFKPESNAGLSATRWGFEDQGLYLRAYYKDKNGIVNPKEKTDEDAISSQENIKLSEILDVVSEQIFSTCPEERR
jgi:hypothetical protein